VYKAGRVEQGEERKNKVSLTPNTETLNHEPSTPTPNPIPEVATRIPNFLPNPAL
jgi:hypothetical protein